MKLKQAIEELRKNEPIKNELDADLRATAIKIVLNYIQNESIPKEKVTEAIKYEKEIAKEPASCGYSGTALHGYTAQVLTELLTE